MKQRKGFTLLELLVTVPLISIILIITYNMLFLSIKSFRYTNDMFEKSEDIRIFTSNIQQEARQAKKATDEKDGGNQIAGLHKPSGSGSKELYIYTDLNGDKKPELIRYQVANNQMIRGVETALTDKFPYTYKKEFKDEKVVLKNVINQDVFGNLEAVVTNEGMTDENDYRRRVTVKIEISTGDGNSPMRIHTILANKSRNQFDE